MGDLGNIAIQFEGDKAKRVFFYTHYCGSEITSTVKRALSKKERWDDPPYLARIIFCELAGPEWGSTTGVGIDLQMGDNEHPILVVDIQNQTIFYEDENGNGLTQPRPTLFKDFVSN